MIFLNALERLSLRKSEPAVVFVYTLDDMPGKTLGVKIPHHAVKAAGYALRRARRVPSRTQNKGYELQAERVSIEQAIKELKKTKRTNRIRRPRHHFFVGPSAQGVEAGLSVGADVLGVAAGREVLIVRSEVLTVHQLVDLHRAAERQHLAR